VIRAAALLAATVATFGTAQAGEWPQSTCAGFIRAMDLSAKYNDPYLNQFYLDEADSMFRAVNSQITPLGMPPLPVPQEAEAQARRAMIVVAECRKNLAATYAEGVTAAYITMRKSLGLPVVVPRKQ